MSGSSSARRIRGLIPHLSAGDPAASCDRHRRGGEDDGDEGAAAGPRLDLDPAADGAHRLAHDREPEPEAVVALAAAAVEAVEEPLPLACRNPLPIVAHLDHDERRVELARNELDLARLRVAEDVLDEVEHDLLEQLRVRERGRRLVRVDDYLDAALRQAHLVGDALEQVAERDRLELERLVARLCAGEREQRAAQAAEAQRLPLDQREETVAL